MLGFLPLGIIATIFAVVLGIWRKLAGAKSYWPKRGIKYFDSSKVLSNWDRLCVKYPLHEAEQMLYEGVKNEGINSFAGIEDFGSPSFYAMDLELIKHILVKDFDHFVDRRTVRMEKTDPLMSKMLINASGQSWRELRAAVSPTFTTGKIRRMYSVFHDSSTKLRNFIFHETEKRGSELEFRDLLGRYTVDVISGAAFGLDSQALTSADSEFRKQAKRLLNSFSTALATLKSLISLWFPNLLNVLGIHVIDQVSTNFFADAVRKSIGHRETTGEKRNDFLQLMIEAKNSNASASSSAATDELQLSNFEKEAQLNDASIKKIQITEDIILAQSLLFFFAGFDTVERLLLLASYELAVNQEVQVRLHAELQKASEENNGELSYDMIMKLEYLDMVISETLRKYPPVVRLERKVTKEYKVPNTNVVLEKGTIAVIPAYGIHTDERYYPNPSKFDPERFNRENKEKRHPYAYMPFGLGPRSCVAIRFALAEGKVAIAHLILDFKLEPSSKTEIPLNFKNTLSGFPVDTLYLRVAPRNY